MSIFVSEKDNFTVVTHYEETNGNIKILSEDSKDKETTKSLSVTCKRPDFGLAQNLLRASTNAQGVDAVTLKNNLLYMLATEWDAKNDKGEKIECTTANLSSLRLEIALDLSEKIEKHLGGIGKLLPIF